MATETSSLTGGDPERGEEEKGVLFYAIFLVLEC